MRRLLSYLLLALAGAPAAAASERVLAERAALAAADARCGLLSAPARAALDAGLAQARGALLRQGAAVTVLTRLERAAAARADSFSCADPAVQADARRAEAGVKVWMNLQEMRFPAYGEGWTARRTIASAWRVVQPAEGPQPARVGLLAAPGGPVFGFQIAAGAPVASAQLRMRDPRRMEASALPQAVRLPDDAVRTVFAAERREPHGDARTVKPPAGSLMLFPAPALAALAALDPRDRAEVEVVFRDGVRQRYRFDVGDLASARAFAGV